MSIRFDGLSDFAGKVKLLRPQKGDILVITGVELPSDPEQAREVYESAKAHVGVDVKFVTIADPDADAFLARVELAQEIGPRDAA